MKWKQYEVSVGESQINKLTYLCACARVFACEPIQI